MTADRPRVLHLDHTSVPGGAEFALRRMLQAEPGWAPLVMVPPGEDSGVFAPLAGIVPVRAVGVAQPAGAATAGAWGAAATGGRLLAHAAATRLHPAFRTADVLDANTARSAAYGAFAARTSRIPFVIHLRDLIDAEALGRFGFETMSRLALPRADAVVANSRTTLDTATPFLRSTAIAEVIPSASGLNPVAPGASRAARVGEAGPVRIGMLARIDPWKGQHLLLDAFAEVVTSGADAVLELPGAPHFGHEDYEAALRASADAAGIADRVRFLGQVENTDALLAGWDIAVQYSTRAEPLGQNVLQYLAAGCAVVVADEGGPAEWIRAGDNGLAIAPRDTAALVTGLRRLLDDPELRVRVATQAPATEGLLSDAQVAERHAALYRRLVTAPRS